MVLVVALEAEVVVVAALTQPRRKDNYFPLINYYNQNGLKQGRRTTSVAEKLDRQLR